MDDFVEGIKTEKPFHNVPVEILVAVGKTYPKVKDLLNLAPEAVLTLDKTVDDPVDLYVGKKLIARGVLEEIEGSSPGQLAVRLTEVVQTDNGS